jgi:hypothetical protein
MCCCSGAKSGSLMVPLEKAVWTLRSYASGRARDRGAFPERALGREDQRRWMPTVISSRNDLHRAGATRDSSGWKSDSEATPAIVTQCGSASCACPLPRASLRWSRRPCERCRAHRHGRRSAGARGMKKTCPQSDGHVGWRAPSVPLNPGKALGDAIGGPSWDEALAMKPRCAEGPPASPPRRLWRRKSWGCAERGRVIPCRHGAGLADRVLTTPGRFR